MSAIQVAKVTRIAALGRAGCTPQVRSGSKRVTSASSLQPWSAAKPITSQAYSAHVCEGYEGYTLANRGREILLRARVTTPLRDCPRSSAGPWRRDRTRRRRALARRVTGCKKKCSEQQEMSETMEKAKTITYFRKRRRRAARAGPRSSDARDARHRPGQPRKQASRAGAFQKSWTRFSPLRPAGWRPPARARACLLRRPRRPK